ncbi:hypothetical protein N9502_03545 [Vicingaceae bacterium]|nr:hypothetical protein [Vicingaceae bacterium]
MSEVNEKKYTSEFEDYILEELILYTNYDAFDLKQTTFNVISTSILTSRIKLYKDCAASESGLIASSKKLNIFLSIIGDSLTEFNLEESYCYGVLLCKLLDNASCKSIMEKALIISNNLPAYYHANLEIISNPESTNHTRDLWLFSVVLRVQLSQIFKNDDVFKKWIWDFHNFLFYIPGEVSVKPIWDLEANNFIPTVIRAVSEYLPEYFNQNKEAGIQNFGTRNSRSMNLPDVFNALQQNMRDAGESVKGDISFTCEGEKINHYCNMFIQGTLVVLSYIQDR